jgi:hypothetical protein
MQLEGSVVKLEPVYKAAYMMDRPNGVDSPCAEMTLSFSFQGCVVGKILITAFAPATMFCPPLVGSTCSVVWAYLVRELGPSEDLHTSLC